MDPIGKTAESDLQKCHLENRLDLDRLTDYTIRIVVTVVTAATLGAAAARAQTSPGRVSGNALDQAGGLLPYVTIAITNRRSMAHYEVRTDQVGHFEIEGLTPGDYLLEADRSAFVTAHESLTVGPGEHLHQDVTLDVAAFEELIVVTGADPPRDSGDGNDLVPDRSPSDVNAARCEPSAIGGDLERPVPIRKTLPEYPRRLRDAGIKGAVVAGGRLSRDGVLTSVRVLSATHPDLAAASLAAIAQWRWTAPRLDCVPIEASLTVTVEFRAAP
jgi:TonB family protein